MIPCKDKCCKEVVGWFIVAGEKKKSSMISFRHWNIMGNTNNGVKSQHSALTLWSLMFYSGDVYHAHCFVILNFISQEQSVFLWEKAIL